MKQLAKTGLRETKKNPKVRKIIKKVKQKAEKI